ncbi:MAG: TM2 domain-containing protein [Thermoguttaceae bacterium]|nr:TM2 domain-containing protein [Thermoguttaceae bacterium]
MQFYYLDSTGAKQGPFEIERIRMLIFQKKIFPDTILETPEGKQGKAIQVPGLFPNQGFQNPLPSRQQPQSQPQMGQKYCTNCGRPVAEQAYACMSCGASPVGHRNFCRTCGAPLNQEQIICIKCGSAVGTPPGQAAYMNSQQRPNNMNYSPNMNYTPKSRVTAACLAIFLGHIGIHKFYMGSWGWGIVYVALVLCTFFIGWFATSIVGLAEGIQYFCMTDEDFAAKYPPETQNPWRW